MDAVEKWMIIRFTPCSSKTYLQIILPAKWLVRQSSTSPQLGISKNLLKNEYLCLRIFFSSFTFLYICATTTGEYERAVEVLGELLVQEVLQAEGLPAGGLHHVAEDRGQVPPPPGLAGQLKSSNRN